MALLLILAPLAFAGLAFAVPSNRWRPLFLPLTGVVHSALTTWVMVHPNLCAGFGWLILDPPGKLVLVLISLLYLFCSVYAFGYLRCRQERNNRVFCACLQGLLGMMTLVVWSHHLGLMWVAMEATSLLTAPLIYFNHKQQSIEATWKYLLVCSVGIAMALLGSYFLAYSSLHEGLESTLLFDDLLTHAPRLSKPWLHAAFVLLLVGYGTKMGLAPMHTWKPDAYGEAPGLVGAILAGGVTSCGFLALLRISHLLRAANEDVYASRLLVLMGLLSMAVAGLFMVGQKDFKRMLAYSSVEHMGILTLGVGMGGGALFGALLHLVNNAISKGVVFLAAGNIHRAYDSKNTDDVTGAMRRLPVSGTAFLFGFLAITGSPPFGPFVSEFTILNAAFSQSYVVTGVLFLVFLMVVFVGMGQTVLRVVQGRPSIKARLTPFRDGFFTSASILTFMALVLMLGVYIPAPLNELLRDAVHYLETRP